MTLLRLHFLILFLSSVRSLWAFDPLEIEKAKQSTIQLAKSKLLPILSKYCGESCQISEIGVEIAEKITDTDELGFEQLQSQEEQKAILSPSSILIAVQIDKTVTSKNRTRLDEIIKSQLKEVAPKVDLQWIPIEIPQILQSSSTVEMMKNNLKRKIESILLKNINDYCPKSCILSNITIEATSITEEEGITLNKEQIISSLDGKNLLRIDSVIISLTFDENLESLEREKIEAMFKAHLQAFEPIQFSIGTANFPQTYAQKKELSQEQVKDPYGLDKLRQMLIMFRDLAGTKEIIQTSETKTSESSLSQSSSNSKDSKSSDESQWLRYGLMILGALGIIGFILLKISSANKDTRLLIQTANDRVFQDKDSTFKDKQKSQKDKETQDKQTLEILEFERIKSEIINLFVNSPKVTKDTFSRLLQEEGVESAANYLHIFGKVIIFELLEDPNLTRNLIELSEYYHKSKIEFTIFKKIELLTALKKKLTASEIKILAQKNINQFEFLNKLDSPQLFALISDENSQLQSVVLTQVHAKKRTSLFQMFEGEKRIKLMTQLSKAETIPKEYLANVALALSKKVSTRPEFDTQNLRSSEVLLELLEKSSLKEQKAIMRNLLDFNQEAARAIKMKLVTIEMIPFLKDSHLLELVMGLKREDLIAFLAGTKDSIRKIFFSHVPRELSESWLEDLETISGIDDERYKIVEMIVLGKIRNLANTGVINVLDINDVIFNISNDSKKDKPILKQNSFIINST